MKMSFYDWCVKTNNFDILNLWDYELNKKSPTDIAFATSKRYYFLCPKGIHRSELYTICNITGEKHQTVNCRRCHSFGQWCLDNLEFELLSRWDCKKNKKSPFEISIKSGKRYYFNCPVNNPNHLSELKIISNVVQQPGSRKCIGCFSFAQWCIDNIDSNFINHYWSSKNEINPFTIPVNYTKEKVWIKCENELYHDDYDIYASNFIKGERCPYCSSKRINIYDSLGLKFPKIITYWSEENSDTPFDYTPYSNKYKLFYCSKHGIHTRKISDVVKGNCECNQCLMENSFSVLQSKVSDYIEQLGYQVKHEYLCDLITINPLTGMRLLYDNQVVELNLYIEVHGQQHYEITSFTISGAKNNNRTPEQELEYQKWKDEYKKNDVLKHQYYYLEIPYWTDDKNETYKKLIDNKIDDIIHYTNC